MKKLNSFTAASLTLSALAIFSSCRDYDVLTEEQLNEKLFLEQILPQYNEAFSQAFGDVDPNHDWGMDEEIGAIEGLSSMGTRAESNVSVVLTNRNQWTEFDNGSKSEVSFPDYGTGSPTVKVPNYRSSALGHDIQIPGYPHLNGLYYTANGNTLDPNYKTGDQITSGMIPAGDVTPYEIQYVSNWFRTNPNPESIELHLSDFFIQNVSCDYDQVEYKASGYNLYQTGWPNTGNNGKNISTVAEARSHKTATGGTYTENLVEAISYDLDYLGFQDMDGNWTHVNNFNRGNSNFSPEDNQSNPNREIKYVKSAGTEDFTCRSSWSTSNNMASKWVLVHLTWNETVKHTSSPYYSLGTTTIPREGYYLAFDFAGEKEGQGGNKQIVHPDGYYSNWIVKITPGHFTSTGNSRRIFCEDLGGSFDFDFNDAVIDVAFEAKNGGYQPIISVQAAGGTLPIYVEKTGDKYELHKMLGSSDMKPINVETSATHATAIYRGDNVTEAKPGKINIIVKNKEVTYKIHGTDADGNGDERSELDGGNTPNLNGTDYKDKTKVAPRAFSAPTSVKWMKELKNIETAYKDFPKWVGDKNWTTAGTSAKWYQNITDGANLLYTPSFTVEGPTGGGSDTAIDWTDLTPAPDAATTVHNVGADSYMKLNDYTGVDPIVTQLDDMAADARVTFTVILSSENLYIDNGAKLEGILVPADISETAMSNNGNTFTVANLTRFNSASYVPTNHDFCASPSTCTSESGHIHTYTLQFSFAKSDIVRTTTGGGYHDYLLLFLKVGDNAVGQGTTIGENNGVTVQKWYVHY